MIRIVRLPLSGTLADRLPPLTVEISSAKRADRARTARAAWKRTAVRRTVHGPLREVLEEMAPGYQRCMYCGDSQGTDIDHFEPLARNPLRTFDWLNHLLACSTCNSNLKRDRFPVDAKGKPLLIDPTTDDPFEHLLLTPSLGVYHPRTEKGRETIAVCGLNRSVLTDGRQQARRIVLLCLEKWSSAYTRGDDPAMHEAVLTVQGQPFADVCQAMLRLALSPGADQLFEDSPEALAMLRTDDLRAALLRA